VRRRRRRKRRIFYTAVSTVWSRAVFLSFLTLASSQVNNLARFITTRCIHTSCIFPLSLGRNLKEKMKLLVICLRIAEPAKCTTLYTVKQLVTRTKTNATIPRSPEPFETSMTLAYIVVLGSKL